MLFRKRNDAQFREFALSGNMYHVLLQVGTPLAFYNSLAIFYRMLDTLMASHINAETVSAVAYLTQINVAVSSVGAGLAVGAGLKISKAYGAGDYSEVTRLVSTLYALCTFLNLFVLLLIPGAPVFLRLSGMPEDLIRVGTTYFRVELAGMILTFFNNAYMAIERSRGNSGRIFLLNTLVTIIKLSLTAFFVYILNSGVTMIAVASVISQAVLFVAGLFYMSGKNSSFRFSPASISLKKETLAPLFTLSFPVIIERVTFAIGKVIVNSMCGVYGSLTVGALGICNNLTGIYANAESGYEEGGSAIIAQNMGAKKEARALEALRDTFIINLVFGTIGLILSMLTINWFSTVYATSSQGINLEFRDLIKSIFYTDALGTIIPWGIGASVTAFLYGIGKTKQILFINFCRLFIFRIGFLALLQRFTSLGSESVGIVMMLSNTLTAVLAVIMLIPELRSFRAKYGLEKVRA